MQKTEKERIQTNKKTDDSHLEDQGGEDTLVMWKTMAERIQTDIKIET